jgi:site-specific DNA recombinase
MRFIGYTRVSTIEQANSGLSLEAQRTRLEGWAALYGHTLLRIEEDAGESAGTLERPALQRALSALQTREAEGLVVVKLDRLTRSVRDLDGLLTGYFAPRSHRTQASALASVSEALDTSTAAGRMVLAMLGVVAQWEREACGERTKEALAQRKRQGKRVGSVPYGSVLGTDGATLAPHAKELATIARARELAAEGRSLRQISRQLAAERCLSRNGQPFKPEQVKRLTTQQ